MTEATDNSDLAAALDQFDRVEANVSKLDRIWKELVEVTPPGVVYGLDSPETENLVRSFAHFADRLPAIDGFRLDAVPMSQDEIAQNRLDAMEVGEIDATVSVERAIAEPGRQLAEYRFRLDRARRSLVLTTGSGRRSAYRPTASGCLSVRWARA